MFKNKKIINLILLSIIFVWSVSNGIKVSKIVDMNVQQQEPYSLQEKFVTLVDKTLKMQVILKNYRDVASLINKYQKYINHIKEDASYNAEMVKKITKSISYAQQVLNANMSYDSKEKIEKNKKKIKSLQNIASTFLSKIHLISVEKFEKDDFKVDHLKKLIIKYDSINRILVDINIEFNNMSISDVELVELKDKINSLINADIKYSFSHLIKKILGYIRNQLEAIKNKLILDINDDNLNKITKEFIVIEKKYLDFYEEVKDIKKEKYDFKIETELSAIRTIRLKIQSELFDDVKKMSIDYLNNLKKIKEELISYEEKITIWGNWDKIEAKFNEYNQNINLLKELQDKNGKEHFSEVNKLANEIRQKFLSIRYIGENYSKILPDGTGVSHYVSEDLWADIKSGAGVTGISIALLSVSGEEIGNLIFRRVNKRSFIVSENIINMDTLENVGPRVEKGLKWVKYGARFGMFLAFSIFVVPSIIISFIHSKGTGVIFTITWPSIIGLTLGVAIDMYRTYKSQPIKQLDFSKMNGEL